MIAQPLSSSKKKVQLDPRKLNGECHKRGKDKGIGIFQTYSYYTVQINIP